VTLNVQPENPPVLFVVHVDVWRTLPAESIVNVMDELAANPVPLAVTVVPTAPLVGLSVRLAVTVNPAVAVFDEPSVAVITGSPNTPAVTLNVQPENPPVLFVVHVNFEPRLAFAVVVNVIDELTANPVPLAATVVPTGPLVGVSVSLAETVNVAVAVFAEPSVAVTVCAPNAPAVTLNVQPENAPLLFVVHADVRRTLPLESIVNVMDELAANPVPLAVTVVPTAPLVGLSVNWGVTVYVVVGACPPLSVA